MNVSHLSCQANYTDLTKDNLLFLKLILINKMADNMVYCINIAYKMDQLIQLMVTRIPLFN